MRALRWYNLSIHIITQRDMETERFFFYRFNDFNEQEQEEK